MQNYLRKKELKAQREKDLREGLQFSKLKSSCSLVSWHLESECWLVISNWCRNGKYEEALERFEPVLGSKPTPDEASVASYNVACCYSKHNQVTNTIFFIFQILLHFEFSEFIRVPLIGSSWSLCSGRSIEVRIWRFQGNLDDLSCFPKRDGVVCWSWWGICFVCRESEAIQIWKTSGSQKLSIHSWSNLMNLSSTRVPLTPSNPCLALTRNSSPPKDLKVYVFLMWFCS